MATTYLHERSDFPDLLRIIEEETGIIAYLVEKDYWLMHVLYGLQQQGFDFKLKGGTSLSKGYQLIDRFSEDIDIYIAPPEELGLHPKSTKDSHALKRKKYYEDLSVQIKISGIVEIRRDVDFDEKYYRSGGIRLLYNSKTVRPGDMKEGILLEAGFDTVTPFQNITVSSWAYDKAKNNPRVNLIDNRAIDIPCYHPGYTFVEKLQTISTKFRKEKESGIPNPNFMRQYYDIYCLLNNSLVQAFIGTEEYLEHKKVRFPDADFAMPINLNEAFLLSDPDTRSDFTQRYISSASLYYRGQPSFEDVLARIHSFLDKL